MKKIILLSSIILSLFSFSSCSNDSDKIYLNQVNNVDSFIYIEKEDLIDLITHKEDFVLTLGLRGCESCSTIKPIINSYIKQNDTPFYWIEMEQYRLAVDALKDDEKYSLKSIVYSASLLLFDEGIDTKLIEYDHKIYKNITSFEKTIKKYVDKTGYCIVNDYEDYEYLPGEAKMYRKNSLTNEQLNNLINKEEKVSVLFSWSECPDCILLLNNYLDKYMKENNGKKLYIFEVNDIKTNLENQELWNNFKSQFQFDNYREGRVPSIVTYQNGQKVDMAVFVNDVIEEENNFFIIKESFWDEMIGFKADTKEDCYLKAAEKEAAFITSYLDKNL